VRVNERESERNSESESERKSESESELVRVIAIKSENMAEFGGKLI